MAREAGLDLGEHVVGRVDQHEIVLRARGRLPLDRSHDVAAHDARTDQPQVVEVALDRSHCVRLLLDEHRTRCASRQRLDAESAGAGVEVEDAGAVHWADEVEDVLADAIGRRPRVEPGWRDELVALAAAGDHAHRGIVARLRSKPHAARRRHRRGFGRRLRG